MPHLSRAQWAKRIRTAHGKTVAAILKLGHTLLAAKKALPHGTFLQMIKQDLPFKASTAQRLMKIAADPKIANAARAQLLPSAWGTLYELTKLPKATFERAASAGTINPQMTRDASRFLTLKVTHEPLRVVAPYYVKEPSEPPKRPLRVVSESAPLLLLEKVERLEKLVTDLSMEVHRHGGVDADSRVEKRIRAVAEKLLSLVEDRPAAAAMLQ